MKLTHGIIRTELARRFRIKTCYVDDEHGLIESPMFMEPGMATPPQHCYVSASTPTVSSKGREKTLFIICDGVPKGSLHGRRDSIIYFAEPQSTVHVFNVLQSIFTKYRRWENALLESLDTSDSLNSLLKLSLPIFENPLFLIDSRFYLLAAARKEQAPDDRRPGERVDDIWILRGKEELIRAKATHEPYFRHLPNDHPRLFINLCEGQYLLGNLSIQASHRELEKHDRYLLIHLANVVRTAMLRSGITDSNRRNLLESMLTRIITGGVIDAAEFSGMISCYGITPEDQFRCLAIRIPQPSGKEFIRNLLLHFGTHVPAMYIPVDEEISAMVLNATMAQQQGIDTIPEIKRILEPYRFRAGLSHPYHDLLLTRYYFTQARYALEKGDAAQEGKCLFLFEEYWLDYILEKCTGELKPAMLWSKGFNRLVEHDLKGRVSYIETLRSFLDNNLNASRTAADLYITRNSLLSRLKRITALLEENLEDPEVRFRYELSLLLYNKRYGT